MNPSAQATPAVEIHAQDVEARKILEGILASGEGEVKEASTASSNLIRRRLRENGFSRLIIEPKPAQDKDLAYLPNTELPVIIEEMKPDSKPRMEKAIKNRQILGFLNSISSLTDIQLENLGLNRSVRERFLRHLVVPTTDTESTPDECWDWTGTRNANKDRGLICSARNKTLVYRLVGAVILGRHIKSLNFMCHKCGNPICSNPRHIYEGDHKKNALDAMEQGTLARGLTSPRSLFKDAKTIQIIRSTGDQHKGREGLISALVRKFGAPWLTIEAIICRTSYRDVPEAENPEELCLPLEGLDLKSAGQSGDAHGCSRLPKFAAILFYRLFHCLTAREDRNLLLEFMRDRYGLQRSSLQDIAYGRARGKFTEFLRKKPKGVFAITRCDPKLFEELFSKYPPLR